MDQQNTTSSSNGKSNTLVPQLVIVQRSRFATFGLLAEAFAEEPHVRLIWDRRSTDRRGSGTSVTSDQRRGDRRRSPDDGWEGLDYVVVSEKAANIPRDDQTVRRPLSTDSYSAAVRMAREDVQRDIEAAAHSDVNVLISGGDPFSRKSLAQQIHRRSGREDRPLVLMNDHLVEDLAAPEADPSPSARFQGAVRDASRANATPARTVLIEEVGELTWSQQTELLAFLDRRARRVNKGGTRAPRDPRIITATRYWLVDRVAATEFRADLFYRLNQIHVVLPAGTVRTLA